MRIQKLTLKPFPKLGLIAAWLGGIAFGACTTEPSLPAEDLTSPPTSEDLRMPAVEDLSADFSGAPPDMALFSCCGHPGDPGNSIGIGKFCMVQTECRSGTLCAYALQPASQSYFCTKICTGPSDTVCAEGATCTKDDASGFHGCVPNTCLGTAPPGCS